MIARSRHIRTIRLLAAIVASACLLLAFGVSRADAAPGGTKGPKDSSSDDDGTKPCRGNKCTDATAPDVAISSPESGTVVDASVTVSGTASDDTGIAEVAVTLDGVTTTLTSDLATWSVTLDTSALAETDHAIDVVATDANGNTASAATSITVHHADTTAPTVQIGSPDGSTSVAAGAVTVEGTASDDVALDAVSIAVDGGTPVTATGTSTWTLDVTLEAGTHTVTATATDAAGNTASAQITVTAEDSGDTGDDGTTSDLDDILVEDPEAFGQISPLARKNLLRRGGLTGVLYGDWNVDTAIFFRDDAGQTSILRLPSDSTTGWTSAATAWPTDEDLFITGGAGPIHVRHYRLSWDGGRPTSAALVAHDVFGDGDSRPGDMITLADGGVVLAWHQQGSSGPQGQFVAHRTPTSSWTTQGPIQFMPTKSSDQVLAQHPVDGSIWLFASPDAWGRIGAAHFAMVGSTLTLDWADAEFLNTADHGLFGPDPENPHLSVAADPAAGDVVLAYQSADREQIETDAGLRARSRVAFARIAADATMSFVHGPDQVERVSAHSLSVDGGRVVFASHPLDRVTGDSSELVLRSFDGSTWSSGENLGSVARPLSGRGEADLVLYEAGSLWLVRR